MIEPLIGERCILCGRKVWKPGEVLCISCDIRACITLGYHRMRAASAGKIPTTGRKIAASRKRAMGNTCHPIGK